MSYRLEFEHLIKYDLRELGIAFPIKLSTGSMLVEVEAKLDCGASACVFERIHGETLGYEIERGYFKKFSTATGYFGAFGHFATMQVETYTFDVMVYFALDEGFRRNVLGRIGFFDHFLVGLNDYTGELYLNRLNGH